MRPIPLEGQPEHTQIKFVISSETMFTLILKVFYVLEFMLYLKGLSMKLHVFWPFQSSQ